MRDTPTNSFIHSTMKASAIFCSILLAAGIANAQTKVTVKGSDTMVILAQKWAETYMGSHKEVSIQVTGGGTGTGVAALQNNTTDLCNASRPLKSAEVLECVKSFKAKPIEYKVALDGLAVYVNDGNAVKELSVPQLKDIFTGKVTNWKDVGGADAPIVIYSRENSSGTYEFFKEHVLAKQDFAATAQTMPGTAAVLQAVAKDPGAIGYGGSAYGAGAKHLLIKKDADSAGVEPNEKTVQDSTYPISRHLYIYVNPAIDKGALNDYLKWIISDDGQKVVKDVGYFALPK
jgi:phosphate transport system substrate-binding protein